MERSQVDSNNVFLLSIVMQILLWNVTSGSSPLYCDDDYYHIGTRCCLKCRAGQHVQIDCSDFTNTSCTGCENGTFMEKPNGFINCDECRHCNAGSGLHMKTECITTLNSLCEPLEGFYCVDFSEGNCVAAEEHSSCQAGQYISKNGSLYEDTECSECSDGSFSTTGSSSWCQPHTQ